MNKIFVAECYAQNVNAEFLINDIPLTIRGPGFGAFWGAPVNQYLVNKKNSVKIIVRPGDPPSRFALGPITGSQISTPRQDERIMIRICSYPKGALIGGPEASEFVRLEWPIKYVLARILKIDNKLMARPLKLDEDASYTLEGFDNKLELQDGDVYLLSDSDLKNNRKNSEKVDFDINDVVQVKVLTQRAQKRYTGEVLGSYGQNILPSGRSSLKPNPDNDYDLKSYPLVKEKSFELGSVFKENKFWQKAETLKLDSKTKLELVIFLTKLQENLATGNVDKFIELTQCRIRDNASAYDKKIEQNIDLIKSEIDTNLKIEGWAIQPLDPADYDFRLCADSKMIHCVAKDWKPILREVPNQNGQGYYDIFVCKVGKKWNVCL